MQTRWDTEHSSILAARLSGQASTVATRPRKLYEAIHPLKTLPQRGRPGREEGTREILFPPLPYVAVYRLKEQSIEVARIYHGAQDRP